MAGCRCLGRNRTRLRCSPVVIGLLGREKEVRVVEHHVFANRERLDLVLGIGVVVHDGIRIATVVTKLGVWYPGVVGSG